MFDNDVEKDEIRVPFRDGKAGNFSLEWCETGMRWLYRERPQTFMDMMYAIMEVERPASGRAKKVQ